MDPFAAIVLLVISFMAYTQGIMWLFIGGMFLILILLRSVPVFIAAIGGIAFLEYFNLQQYWFAVLALLAVMILWREHRKKKSEEFYSPEMMQMLEG